MSTPGKKLIVVYEREQLDLLFSSFSNDELRNTERVVIVALDAALEIILLQKDIPHFSLREFHRNHTFFDLALWKKKAAETWYTSPDMSFFTVDTINVGRAFELSIALYLWRLGYLVDVFDFIFSSHTINSIWIPESYKEVPKTAGVLAVFEIRTHTDVASLYATQKHASLEIVSVSKTVRGKNSISRARWNITRVSFHAYLAVRNAFVAFFSDKNKKRIFVSDYWRNIEPFLTLMPDVEVFMMDRIEYFKATPGLWRHKMRFYHPHNFSRSDIEREVAATMRKYTAAWNALHEEPMFASLFTYKNIPLWPIVREALTHIVTAGSVKVVRDFKCSKRLIEKKHIDHVIIRASVSNQTHFFSLAQAAKAMNIPSIELQHGLEYNGPYSISERKNAEYVATYGPSISAELKKVPVDGTPVEIGSPRFDTYSNDIVSEKEKNNTITTLGLNPTKPIVLFIVPEIYGHVTSFDLLEMFSQLKKLQQTFPDMQLILKMRPYDAGEDTYRMLIQDTFEKGFAIAHQESIAVLCALSDFVISTYSTVILEVMMSQKPVLLWGLHPFEEALSLFHFMSWEKAGAVLIPRTQEELEGAVTDLLKNQQARQTLVSNALRLLQEKYMFDGHSAERMRDFIASV